MIRKQKEEIEWLEFELLADIPGLAHGVFLRHGGVSQGPYSSLNAGEGKGDDAQAVQHNRLRIKRIMQLNCLISANQVHGTTVVTVSDHHDPLPNCDGIMTENVNLGLMIKHADCQAAIFYDPQHRAIANVHCGWRGNVQNIYEETIIQMQRRFSSRPENILVGISPSLGPDKAEFVNYRLEFPESFLSYQIKPYYFDLWEIAKSQLEKAGVLSHHIEIASLCTYSHPEDFFSFRRDNRVTGNHATVVALR